MLSSRLDIMEDADALYPWNFPGRESYIHYLPEVESTMDIARELAREGCPEFTVVIAERQRKGRGRLKRVWLSADGGLYFTLVLRPQLPPMSSFKVNFGASLILTRVLRNMFGVNAMVKWPNDILVEGKKICGMLSEMEADAEKVAFVNVGIGINVNNDPQPVEQMAVSLKQILGEEVSRQRLLAAFLDELERFLYSADFDHVISAWKQYATTIGQQVKVVTHSAVSEGVAVDVDEDGALLLKCADGLFKKIIYGDCFHQNGST